MKHNLIVRFVQCLLASALLLAVSGCATDLEDRAFFAKGWWKPEEGANTRFAGSQEAHGTEDARFPEPELAPY